LRPFLSVIVIPPRGYDEPGTLAYAISSICPVSADGEHSVTSAIGKQESECYHLFRSTFLFLLLLERSQVADRRKFLHYRGAAPSAPVASASVAAAVNAVL
jgi:hypothetical protein